MYGYVRVWVIWNDGNEEDCGLCLSATVRDGVLVIEVDRVKVRHIPLTSIREYVTDES